MEYKLRQATIDDVPLIKLIHKNESKHLGSINLYQVWDKYINGDKVPYTFVVLEGKGFCRYGYSKKYNHFIVHEIGVLPEYKRQGIARYILSQIPRPLMLKCNVDNEAGNIFYKSCGMRLSGITETKNGVKQNIWVI